MANQSNAAGAATVSNREADLIAQVARLEAEATKREAEAAKLQALGGVTIRFEDGITKKGQRFTVLNVKGINGLSWQGLNLNPTSWDHIKQLAPFIDSAMKEHAADFISR